MNIVKKKTECTKLITAARYRKGYERLEPYAVKVARTVLRRGRASNRSFLFGVQNASEYSLITNYVHRIGVKTKCRSNFKTSSQTSPGSQMT